jgi:hypothetical protein
MSRLEENKEQISDYFSTLVNEVNAQIELELTSHKNVKEFTLDINAKRDAFIKEIRECEAFSLQAIVDSPRKDDKDIPNDQLFAKFCFLIQTRRDDNHYNMEHRLVVADKFFSPGQIKCLQASLMQSESLSTDEMQALFFDSKTLVNFLRSKTTVTSRNFN